MYRLFLRPWKGRYADWSALNTMHPLAWPWVLYMSARIKFWERIAKDAQND